MMKSIETKLKGLLLIAFSFYLLTISWRLGSYKDSLNGLGLLISQDIHWAVNQMNAAMEE